ncbi:hypothetical protein [Shinella sp. M27]|uniref:hypothetical protein n=1 Tax=Shinella sp. M27 TaxID=3368614 RepID=UPI003BA24353
MPQRPRGALSQPSDSPILAKVKERALRLAVGESGRLAKTVTTISILLAQEIIEEDNAA